MTKKEAAALAAQQSGAMDTDSAAAALAPAASDGSVLQRLTGEALPALRAPCGSAPGRTTRPCRLWAVPRDVVCCHHYEHTDTT